MCHFVSVVYIIIFTRSVNSILFCLFIFLLTWNEDFRLFEVMVSNVFDDRIIHTGVAVHNRLLVVM